MYHILDNSSIHFLSILYKILFNRKYTVTELLKVNFARDMFPIFKEPGVGKHIFV